MNFNIICSETYSYITLNDINLIKEPKNFIKLKNIKHSLLFLSQSIIFLSAMLFNSCKKFGQTTWSIMTNKWILFILHAIFIIFVFLSNFSFVCNFNLKKIKTSIIQTLLIFMFHFLIFFWCFIYFHAHFSWFTFFSYQAPYLPIYSEKKSDSDIQKIVAFPNKILYKLKTSFFMTNTKWKNKWYIRTYIDQHTKAQHRSKKLMFMIGLYFVLTIVCLCIYGNYFLIKNPYIILSIFIITLIFFILTLEKCTFMENKDLV